MNEDRCEMPSGEVYWSRGPHSGRSQKEIVTCLLTGFKFVVTAQVFLRQKAHGKKDAWVKEVKMWQQCNNNEKIAENTGASILQIWGLKHSQ